MRPQFFMILIPALALLATGCSDDPEPADDELEAETPVVIEESDVTSGPATPVPSGDAQTAEEVGPMLHLAEDGDYLVDARGNALYTLMGEKNGGATCNAACLDAWPPFVVTDGEPFADDPGIQSTLIDTRRRDDGTTQVTYNGHPLYYYAEHLGEDHEMEYTTSDRWGMWHAVLADGSMASGPPADHAMDESESMEGVDDAPGDAETMESEDDMADDGGG